MYTNISRGLLFVTGPEDFSKGRFIFKSMLPNIILGFIPYIIFMVRPELGVLGTIGSLAIASGAGDYYNVFNAATQVPSGGRVYNSGLKTYWFIPKTEDRG